MLLVCVSKISFIFQGAGDPPFKSKVFWVESVLVACNCLLPLKCLEILEGQAAHVHACRGEAGCPAYLVFLLTIPKRVFSLLPLVTCQNKTSCDLPHSPSTCVPRLEIFQNTRGKTMIWASAPLEASVDFFVWDKFLFKLKRASFSCYAAANMWEEWLTFLLEVVKWTGLSAAQCYSLYDIFTNSPPPPPHCCFGCLHAYVRENYRSPSYLLFQR